MNTIRAHAVGWMWLVAAVAVLAATAATREHELANYGTSLAERTANQAHNARLAARALDGQVIAPGGEFSFNRTVGPWTRDRGYRKAMVSYGGEMVLAYGGGVCQASTTLYNAALLAGLRVVERDHHVWVPGYVAAGRDAAVAQGAADLRLVNPYPAPLRLRATTADGRLTVRVLSTWRPERRCQVATTFLEASQRAPLVRFERHLPGDQTPRVRSGRPGVLVRVERLVYRGHELVARETVSEDRYLPLGPVTAVGAGP